MKTTRTKTGSQRRATADEIDVFLGFALRVKTLEFFAGELRRLEASGEEILDEIAALRPSGDAWRDERVRDAWEEKLDAVFDEYHRALDRLGWEMID